MSSKNNTINNSRGFTIAEIAITLPIAALVVLSLMTLLFSQYSAVLAEVQRSNLRTSGQAFLNALQDELLFTIEYGHTIHEDLGDPHEPSGGWQYDTDPQTLIIHEVAIDAPRADINRNIVRKKITPCESSQVTANPIAINNIIYYLKDNPDNQYKSLYKRTIVPEYDLCGIDQSTGLPCEAVTSSCLGNYRQTSCPEEHVGQNNCTRSDQLLSDQVVDFAISYYQKNNIETSFPSAAEKIEISIVLGDQIFGRDVTVGLNQSMRKIN